MISSRSRWVREYRTALVSAFVRGHICRNRWHPGGEVPRRPDRRVGARGLRLLVVPRSLLFTLLTAPIAVTLLASGLRKYPFAHRLILFLYPLFILLLCVGLGRVLQIVSHRQWVAALLVGAVLGPPVAKAAYGMITQPATQAAKPLLRLIGENYRDGDLVWVDTSAGGPY